MPLFLERLSVFSRRVSVEIKNKSKLLAAIPVSIVIASLLPIHSESIQKIEPLGHSNVVLSTALASAVTLKSDLPKIVPGESKINRENRLKEEAAAKKAAEKAAQIAAVQASQKATEVNRETVSRGVRITYSDPVNFNDIYQRAGSMFGVNPILLKAVHTVETGASGSTSRSSYAGAVGPMQFLPSTFYHYGVDGNGDGRADITNVSDAIFTAAKYLKACGYPDVRKALWGYNPSASYYNKVMGIAYSFGM